MSIGGDRKWTVAIRPASGERPRKITKILGLNGGGFSVLAPYHKARSGFLFKQLVRPNIQGPYTVPFCESAGFTVEDRVKLSYHTDGFAQFSSETPGRILSGRDPATGEPKGLGLFTNPLETPIFSGGSVGVTIWGIDEFEETTEGDEPFLFEPGDTYYRGCTPDDANAWHLQIYAFPKVVVPPLRFRDGNALLDVALEPVSGGGRLLSVVQLKVIHLPKEKVFLGLFVNRQKTNFPPKSGWILHGPGDFTGNRNGHVLMDIYPRDVIPVEGRGSLDRTHPAAPSEEWPK
ncbi:MAG: hypothetical protein ABSH52_18145 [Terriglobia bacterium]